MASNAGRVKSCFACRKMKKRCDRRQPGCSLCEKLNLQCTYLQRRELTVVNHAAPPTSRPWPHDKSTAIGIPTTTTFSRTAHDAQLLEAFWSFYLPADDGHSSLSSSFRVTPRLSRLRDVTHKYASVRPALNACVFNMLGRQGADLAMIHRSMECYGQSISGIQLKLGQRDLGSLRSVILSCRLLTLYEVMRPGEKGISSQGKDWRRHVQATCNLINILNSLQCEKDQALEDGAIYDEIQRLAFRADFTRRRQDCLRGGEWRHDLSIKDGSSKTLRSRLSDAMAAIPALLEQSDRALSVIRAPVAIQHRKKLLSAVPRLVDYYIELDRVLQDWEFDVLEMHQDSEQNTPSTNTFTSEANYLYPISQLHGYGFLLAVNEYWASRLVICCQAQRVISIVEQDLSQQLPILPTCMSDPWSYMSNIARSAVSLLSPEAGMWVSEQSVYPIATCMHTLAGLGGLHSAEMQMIKTAISQAKGAAFTHGFLKSMAAESVPDDIKGDMDVQEDACRMGAGWYG